MRAAMKSSPACDTVRRWIHFCGSTQCAVWISTSHNAHSRKSIRERGTIRPSMRSALQVLDRLRHGAALEGELAEPVGDLRSPRRLLRYVQSRPEALGRVVVDP